MSHLKPLSYIIKPEDEQIFSEMATVVSVDDEAAGAFIVMSQCGNDGYQKLKIDFSEWGLICEAVELLKKEWADAH